MFLSTLLQNHQNLPPLWILELKQLHIHAYSLIFTGLFVNESQRILFQAKDWRLAKSVRMIQRMQFFRDRVSERNCGD